MMDAYKLRANPSFTSAPEVVPQSIPERAEQDSEAPQSVEYSLAGNNVRPYYGTGVVVGEKKPLTRSTKRTTVLSILGALVALLIGIGIGVGIGVSVEKNEHNSSTEPLSPGWSLPYRALHF